MACSPGRASATIADARPPSTISHELGNVKKLAKFVTDYHYIRYYLSRPAPVATRLTAGELHADSHSWAIIASYFSVYGYNGLCAKVAVSDVEELDA